MLINKNIKVSTSEKTIKKVVKLMLKLYLDNDTLMKKATPVGFEPTQPGACSLQTENASTSARTSPVLND